MTYNLIYYFLVLTGFLVVFIQVLKTVIFLELISNLLIVCLSIKCISWVIIDISFLILMLILIMLVLSGWPGELLSWGFSHILYLSTEWVSVVLKSLCILRGSLSLCGWFLISLWLLLWTLLSLLGNLYLHFVQLFKELLIFLLQLLIQLPKSVIFFLAFFKPLRSFLGYFTNFSFKLINLLTLTLCPSTNHLQVLLTLFKGLLFLVNFVQLYSFLFFNILH